MRSARQLIRAGKLATVVTLKTFLAEIELPAGVTMQAYLARLAAEATTIINAEDYGRTVHDLAVRRELIIIGEDIVNTAYDSPIDAQSARSRSRKPSASSMRSPKPAATTAVFSAFADALTIAIDMASSAYMRDGHLSGIATGLVDLDEKMGGLQKSDLIIVAGRPGMGKTALATNIAFNIARAYQFEVGAGRLAQDDQWRDRRLLLARNVGRTIGDARHRRAIRRAELQNPSRRHQ